MAAGHAPAPADGVFWGRTREAPRVWQESKGLAVTGRLTREQPEGLAGPGRAEAEARGKQVGPPGTRFRDCPECPEMVVAPAGRFMMGSPWWEVFRWPSEGPVHEVAMAHPFAVGVYEVTFGEWDACVSGGGCGGYRPDDEGWGRGSRPVVNVGWNDAQAYVRWLSGRTGEGYRLPSESEWEYAARAGTQTKYFWWGEEIGLNRADLETCVELSMHGSGEDARMVARWEKSPMQESRWLTKGDVPRCERWKNERMWLVGWEDAQAYVAWLSRKTGERYRLLHESQWDGEARAGTGTGYFWWGDGNETERALANYGGVLYDKGRTAPVGSFPANAFGLHDVHGNVWEWVEDPWHDSYHGAPSDGRAWGSGDCGERVMRGGSWLSDLPDLRSASRIGYAAGRRGLSVGFRVARTLAP